jgi:hypothetical protein
MKPAIRRPLCLLLLIAAPFAGLWLGEGMLPLVSIPGAVALLTLAFGAALLSPSPHTREKYYVLLAATLMFVGAWSAGHKLVKQGIAECLERGDEVQSALESYRADQGTYPQQLEQLGIQIPGRLRLRAPLLHYQRSEKGYRLYFTAENLLFEATHYTPFTVQRRED